MIILGDESARPRLLKLANRMTSSRFSTQTASIFLMLCIKISTAMRYTNSSKLPTRLMIYQMKVKASPSSSSSSPANKYTELSTTNQ